MIPQGLEEYLKKSHVDYEVRHHPPTMTAEELAQRENVDGHEVAKVVVMRENGQYYMMVLPASYFIDMEMVRQTTGHPHLQMAPEEDLRALFPDCEMGAMPPMGTLYNMPVYVEQDLTIDNTIEFNGGTHEDAIRMKYADYQGMVHPQVTHFSRNWREFLE